MSNKPRVIVVNPDARFCLDEAKKFGDVVYLFEDSPARADNPEHFIRRIRVALKELRYNVYSDVICLSASPMTLFYLGMALAEYPAINFLLYSSETEDYTLIPMQVKKHASVS